MLFSQSLPLGCLNFTLLTLRVICRDTWPLNPISEEPQVGGRPRVAARHVRVEDSYVYTCMCMFMYIYLYTHIHTYTCTYTHMYFSLSLSLYRYIYIYIYICIYIRRRAMMRLAQIVWWCVDACMQRCGMHRRTNTHVEDVDCLFKARPV